MLTTLPTTTPTGAIWADARACGIPATAIAAAKADAGYAMRAAAKRPQAGVFGGSNGTHVSNGMGSNGATKLRPEGLGGSSG
ncbi:MAG TPA: hypothetical protein VM345_16815 [Acidimicrobiales bacterium]|nr:hypothetical protein [Acidimicrobiales bacterium]